MDKKGFDKGDFLGGVTVPSVLDKQAVLDLEELRSPLEGPGMVTKIFCHCCGILEINSHQTKMLISKMPEQPNLKTPDLKQELAGKYFYLEEGCFFCSTGPKKVELKSI